MGIERLGQQHDQQRGEDERTESGQRGEEAGLNEQIFGVNEQIPGRGQSD